MLAGREETPAFHPSTAAAGQKATTLPSTHRRLICLGLLCITVPVGMAWRLAPLHLPPFAFKYGGSALWAVAVYWLVAIARPRWSSRRLALTAAAIALLVELFKLVYWPPLDRFRHTLAGKLLLGRYFTVGAVIAYWTAIAAVALLDHAPRQRRA